MKKDRAYEVDKENILRNVSYYPTKLERKDWKTLLIEEKMFLK